MLHEMFSIYDSKAKAYLPPFILPNSQMAQRTFGDCVNSEKHQFHAHPEDYTLFQLGTFDDAVGKFMPATPVKVNLGTGIEYINHLGHNRDLFEEDKDQDNGQEQSDQEI